MDVFTKSIRKLMGWCSNARASEARRNINLENYDSDVLTDQGEITSV